MWSVLRSKSKSWNPVERLIFPAPAASYNISSFPDELIFIPRADGQKVPCLLLPFKHARFLVIYFHANAEDLGLCYSFCKIMRDLFQVHVLAVEYPGYGICPGNTDEAGILANARAAMYFAMETLRWPSDGIKLFGRSLGTGATIQLATQYTVAGVILVSPFTSIRDVIRCQANGRFASVADYIENRFHSEALAPKVRSPTLIIHGQQDALIPISHGKAIYDHLSSRKMMVCPQDMGHNTSLLRNPGTLVLPMTQFFSLPDYSFEDIQVPLWVYPPQRERQEVPSCRPSCSATCMPEWVPDWINSRQILEAIVEGTARTDERAEREEETLQDDACHEIPPNVLPRGSPPHELAEGEVSPPQMQQLSPRAQTQKNELVQTVRPSPRGSRGEFYGVPREIQASRHYQFAPSFNRRSSMATTRPVASAYVRPAMVPRVEKPSSTRRGGGSDDDSSLESFGGGDGSPASGRLQDEEDEEEVDMDIFLALDDRISELVNHAVGDGKVSESGSWQADGPIRASGGPAAATTCAESNGNGSNSNAVDSSLSSSMADAEADELTRPGPTTEAGDRSTPESKPPSKPDAEAEDRAASAGAPASHPESEADDANAGGAAAAAEAEGSAGDLERLLNPPLPETEEETPHTHASLNLLAGPLQL